VNIIHIIVGLDVGGAEISLRRLIQSMRFFKHTVISLTVVGTVGQELRKQGVNVIGLEMKKWQFVIPIFRLCKIIRDLNPDIIQTWMYHADLVGSIAGMLAGGHRIIWGVRNTNIPQGRLSVTYVLVRVAALLSHFIPSAIICNSEAGRVSHIRIGYNKKKTVVITNGFDSDTLNSEGFDKNVVRSKYNLPITGFIVGVVARFDSLKGYETMISVADWFFKNQNKNVKFVFVGKHVNKENPFFYKINRLLDFGGNVVLLGELQNVPEILVAFDVLCSPSISEGFPNVVAEAMLMGKPCIVTDVGDSKLIVGNTGIVVPPNNPDSIQDAILIALKMSASERVNLGKMARERVINNYEINKMVSSLKAVYKSDFGLYEKKR
jgi:glycosyltransferase involved in cell wall biosynthesis